MDIDALTLAVNVLIRREDYADVRREVLALAGTRNGVFEGDLWVLNALLDLARKDGVERLDPLFLLADSRNRQLYPPDRKTEYQRGYMASRRRRLGQASDLYCRVTGKSLSREERKALHTVLMARWMMRRNEVLDSMPDLDKDQRNEMVRLFWQDIDSEIQKGLTGDTEVAHNVLGL